MSADDKAAAAWDDYVSQQQQEKIEELERQLNAANAKIKRLEKAASMALHGCYNGPMPDHVRDALDDAMEAKP